MSKRKTPANARTKASLDELAEKRHVIENVFSPNESIPMPPKVKRMSGPTYIKSVEDMERIARNTANMAIAAAPRPTLNPMQPLQDLLAFQMECMQNAIEMWKSINMDLLTCMQARAEAR